ncbi:nicotinate phosphoribosyltransferase [Candidatus Omnitrophota bacterium]
MEDQKMNIQQSLSLLVDFYELTMAVSYFEHRREAKASFDLFIRRLPENRSYFVVAGLEDALEFLKNLHFDAGACEFLKQQGKFSDAFLEYLSALRFSGDVWALPEGELCFPNEPIIRVVAPIIEAQLVESFLLNTINLQTTIATKASRVVTASQKKAVYDFSLRRTHGSDAALKVARAAYLAGFQGTSNCLAGLQYKIPVVGTMAHSFVMSFENEADSFKAFARTFPNSAILLVDTYDTIQGVKNAIKVAQDLEEKGSQLKAIRLDSGNLIKLSRISRRMLDKARLPLVKIFASGNLDEFKIEELLRAKAPIDSFGVGTNMGVSKDAPYCDVIYKICEITNNEGQFLPTMKLSAEKVTYPGRKQVFRLLDSQGMFAKDIIALEDEAIEGRPLLKKVIEEGKDIYSPKDLEDARRFAQDNMKRLPEKYKKLKNSPQYPVEISPKLKKLTKTVVRYIKKRSR